MTGTEQVAADNAGRFRRAGRALQGLVLGPLLVIAMVKLLALAGNITAFKYQGF